MAFPDFVKIVEVGPRDGLQNEKNPLSTAIKVEFINRLSATGLSVIEATSFVSAKAIPQLADHQEVFQKITRMPNVAYPVFVPNLQGLKNALAVGVQEVAVFTTPSEEFCQRNINCSVEQSLQSIVEIAQLAKQNGVRVRGYISCILGCPYEGEISSDKVANLAEKLIALGCYEVSLGDTIGVGTPFKTQDLLKIVMAKVAKEKLAVHFHDTYGQALVNIYVALELGIAVVDSSVGGLGGCPYAKGATGNVATEKVIYMLDEMKIKSDVNLGKILDVVDFILPYTKLAK